MALPDLDLLTYLPPRLLAVAERYLKALPLVRDRLDQETRALAQAHHAPALHVDGGIQFHHGEKASAVPTLRGLRHCR